ncbi:MAG: MarR family transcriptional regulator [Spirochaetaceae bacterium]|nr:MarR family transcriptional regulator [Spirochaetaceae bacterium]
MYSGERQAGRNRGCCPAQVFVIIVVAVTNNGMDDRFDTSGDPSVAAFQRLMRTSLRIKRVVGTVFHRAGITGAQFFTLVRIPDDGIPLTKLAARSWADPGNASGVVDRLVREGLVERRPADGDRRVVLVHATAAGRQRISELRPEYERRVRRVMEALTAAELNDLNTLLEKLSDSEEPNRV